MDYKLFKTKDNADAQLDSGISASTLIIPLKTDQGDLFPDVMNGNATSDGSNILLNSTGIGAKNAQIGDFIYNLDDGSHAFVVSVDTNSLSTTELTGGSDNTWQNGDEYVINPFVVTLNKRVSGQISAYEKILIKAKNGDFLTAKQRGYDGDTPQPFGSDDYVSLFLVSKNLEEILSALGEQALDIQDLKDTKASISYVETLLQARNWKDNVRIAISSNVDLATELKAGDTQEGIVLAENDDVALVAQTDAKENGIYTINALGAPIRRNDFDESAEITNASVAVKEGSSNADSIWMCTSDDPAVGTDNIEFVKIYPSTGNIPTGTISQFAGNLAPTGWLIADGSEISRTTYANLFALIGELYGNGDGSTTFNLPDLKGKVVVGLDSEDSSFDTMGETGGEKEHLLTSSESGIPAHTHPLAFQDTGDGQFSPDSRESTFASGTSIGNTRSNTATNASEAHNNLQPYLVLNYIIKT